jgi:hypothetical protein
MKRTIIASAVTFVILTAFLSREFVTAQQVAQLHQRWEYAQFALNPQSQTEIYIWTSPGGKVAASTWEDFGAKYPRPFKMGDNYLTSVLNAVGSDGWELCVYSQKSDGENWIFKRPVQ